MFDRYRATYINKDGETRIDEFLAADYYSAAKIAHEYTLLNPKLIGFVYLKCTKIED